MQVKIQADFVLPQGKFISNFDIFESATTSETALRINYFHPYLTFSASAQ